MALDGSEIAGIVFGGLIVVGLGYKFLENKQGNDRYQEAKEESRNRDSNALWGGVSRRRKNNNQNKSKRR